VLKRPIRKSLKAERLKSHLPDALRMEIKAASDDNQQLREIARKLLEKASKGDMPAIVSSVGQSLDVQLEKLKGCDRVFKEKRSGVDAGRPALRQCLEFLRDGDSLLVTKIDRLARSTSDLYRIGSDCRVRERHKAVVLPKCVGRVGS
jgi:hypothetical protein